MYERFTDRARKVMQLANQEAQRLNHHAIGTEHVLIGIAKEGSGVAAKVMRRFGIDLGEMMKKTRDRLSPGPDMIVMGKLSQTPGAKEAVEFAIASARDLGHNYVGTEHLLLGLLRQETGLASEVLREYRLTSTYAKEAVKVLLYGDETVGQRKDFPEGITVEAIPATMRENMVFHFPAWMTAVQENTAGDKAESDRIVAARIIADAVNRLTAAIERKGGGVAFG